MKNALFIALIICLNQTAKAQQQNFIDTAIVNATLKATSNIFPKFYREFQSIKQHDTLVKQIHFFRSITPASPAYAAPKGVIFIDISYLEKPKPDFDDNRMIVVLYHEIGHLHYFVTVPPANWNPANNERAAFEYSLFKTKEMADEGDCLPLKTGLKFMKLRSESNDMQDQHVRALKILVNEPVYFDYLKYIATHCG